MKHRQSFESTILSTIIFEPIMLENIKDLIPFKAFIYYQEEYKAILSIVEQGKPIDESLIASRVSYPERLIDIMSSNPVSESTFNQYIDEILELYKHDLVTQLSNEVREENLSIDEKIDLIKKRLDEVEHSVEAVEDIDGDSLLSTQFQKKATYMTGIKTIDSYLGGLEQGQLIYITGAEEAGKTHVSYKIMENLSVAFKTGIISLEFGKRKLKERLEGMIKRGQKLQAKNIKASFESHNINKIEKIIKKWASEGVGFIVVDSFNLIENNKSSDNNQNIIDTGRRLFKLTQQLDILLLVISTSTKADHKEGNPSIYGGQLLNHYCDQKWHILRNLENEDRILWINKNKQNYTYPKEPIYFNKDGSISGIKVETMDYIPEQNDSINQAVI